MPRRKKDENELLNEVTQAEEAVIDTSRAPEGIIDEDANIEEDAPVMEDNIDLESVYSKKEELSEEETEALNKLDSIVDSAVEEIEKAADTAEKKRSQSRQRQAKGLPEDIASGDLVNRASRRAKRRIYSEDEVVTIDPDTKVETEADKRRATWLELVQSAKSHTILEGTLVSCKRTKNGDNVLAVVSYKDATVYIPAKFLFEFDESAILYNEDSGITKEAAMLNAQLYYTNLRFGMPVKFVCIQVFENDPNNPEGGAIAYASRIAAIQQLARESFVDKTADGKPLLYEGLEAQGTITYLSRTGVGVEVFGVDAFIPSNELSWRRIGDVRTDEADYHVGQNIVVKIGEVSEVKYTPVGSDQTFNLIHARMSAREAQSNPNVKWFNFFEEGQIVLGQVTQITEDGIFVFAANKRDMLCEFPQNLQIPPIGSLVQVKVMHKRESDKAIYAVIRKIIRMGGAN